MVHYECKNYINLDCEKGMCALSKAIVYIDGENSGACENFKLAEKCGNCKHFVDEDKYGIGTCRGLEKENWAYSTCGASTCSGYEVK